MNIPEFLVRWIHLVAAGILIGGAAYSAFVTLHVLPTVSDAERDGLRERIRLRWGHLFQVGLVLALGSGFWNYMAYKMAEHKGQGAYHGVMGVKILLAMVVFFLGSALTGRAKAFEPLRRKAGLWQMVNVLLGLGIVALAGVAHGMK